MEKCDRCEKSFGLDDLFNFAVSPVKDFLVCGKCAEILLEDFDEQEKLQIRKRKI